jgi:hypothetical protein
MPSGIASRFDRTHGSLPAHARATKVLADDMTHAALTPLLGREFDNFLFASIADDQNGPLLSVVSAFARLDVDPWKEAVSLAGMPRLQAIERLSSLISSLPKGPTAQSPKAIAVRLIALLAPAARLNAPAPAALRQVALIPRASLFIGLGVLALLLLGAVIFTERTSNAPAGIADAPASASDTAPRR